MWLRQHSDSDLVTALAAAGREDGATGTGTHAQAEAMLLVTLAVVRLESALHDELRWFWGEDLDDGGRQGANGTESRVHGSNRLPSTTPSGLGTSAATGSPSLWISLVSRAGRGLLSMR